MKGVYGPIGRCIYCDATDDLSREHILPFALGGTAVILKASCPRHRDITSMLERRLARDLYGDYRIAADAPSRRVARRRGARVVEGVTFDGREVEVSVPIKELPRLVMVADLAPPELMRGLPPSRTIAGMTLRMQDQDPQDQDRYQAIMSRHGLRQISVASGGMQLESFIRALAKIGHAAAVAELGLGRFEPLLLPLIDGQTDKYGYYVGGFDPRRPQLAEQLALRTVAVAGQRYAVIDISFHALPRCLPYQVVAGRI